MESPAEAASSTSRASTPDAQFCGVVSKKEVYVRIVDGSKSTIFNYA